MDCVPRTRLVVADDNPLLADRVAGLLSADFDVVAYVSDGQQALDAVSRLRPDLLVLDISMPVMSGPRAAERLREVNIQVPIVFLSVHEDEEFVCAARAAGGLGYVVKSRMGSDLVPAVKAALAGQRFLSPPLSR
jgi:DNA-binding NarL/FixJ family response regulator